LIRKANAIPGGGGGNYGYDRGAGGGKLPNPIAATRAKRQANARVFGQDLMRGEHVVGERTSTPAGLTFGEIKYFDGAGREITGTSIFDPVLCELAYRWFLPARRPGARPVRRRLGPRHRRIEVRAALYRD
jgi:hypothetical protein